MNLILKIFGSIFSAAVTLVLIWGLLYLCITPVKDWTDENIFKTQQEEETQENTQTNMFVNFDTHTITLEV